MKFGKGFRSNGHRSLTGTAVTALVIALVILINVAVGALFSGQLWWIDLTKKELHSLSPAAEKLLGQTLDSANREAGGEVLVEIIFCADPDMITGNGQLRYAYYTAKQMEKAFSDRIKVSTTNVWSNPSSVDEYRVNAYSSIYQSNVIVASGTEFRVISGSAFVKEDAYGDGFNDYYGEKLFLSTIMAVTRAEAPICCLTVNHGEAFATDEGKANYSEFVKVIENAGYRVQYLDLEKEEIPADCRLIITLDPQTDFVSDFGSTGTVSEAKKLEKYLAETNSFMVFTDADTPKLFNLEELLEQWGIAYGRYTETDENGSSKKNNLQVIDRDYAIDGTGALFYGQYASGAGSSALADVIEEGGSPKVLFGNAGSIGFSSTYTTSYHIPSEDDGEGNGFTYGEYYKNGKQRNIFSMFHAGETALCYAKQSDGSLVLDKEGNPLLADTSGSYYLMTLSNQSITINESSNTTINDASYVCAVASTEFASNAVLQSDSYGNTDVLLSILYEVSREIEPVGLDSKIIDPLTIADGYYTEAQTTTTTVILVLLPAVVFAVAGIVILIKRRVRS